MIILSFQLLYGQKNDLKKDTAFLNWFIQNSSTRPFLTPYSIDSITVYSNGISNKRIDEIKNILNADTLADIECKKNIIVFNKYEREYILKQLEKMKSELWPEKLFKNSLMIDRDTINTMFKKTMVQQVEFFRKYPHGYSFFSRPIFIRKNTICIFYSGYNCASNCFDDQLFIMRKEAEDWVPFILLIDGVGI